MARGSRNASIPNVPNSRATPECLNPPQGACGSSRMPLIATRPARICKAPWRPRCELYVNNASAIPGQISARCAESLHSQYFPQGGMCLCVMWNRHCPSIDSAPRLTVALDSVRPRIVLMLAANLHRRVKGRADCIQDKDGCCGATCRGVRERLSLKAKSRRDKLFEAYLEKLA